MISPLKNSLQSTSVKSDNIDNWHLKSMVSDGTSLFLEVVVRFEKTMEDEKSIDE